MSAGCLDAPLAGLLWALVDARMPVVVAAPSADGRTALRDVLVGLLPAGVVLRSVDPADTAETIPMDPPVAGPVVLVAPDLGAAVASATALGPDPTRAVVRAVAAGHGLVATIEADSLASVLDRLSSPPVSLDSDHVSLLGLVLVLGPSHRPTTDHPVPDVGDPTGRVLAAHWIRPVVRDAHGHLQRLGPAVLATWDDQVGRWEHFAWGVMPELAMRIGRRPGDLDRDVAARSDLLDQLLRSDASEAAVRQAIAGYRGPLAGA